MQLFRRFRAPKPTFSAPLAPDEPFFAVGDLHGCDALLDRMITRMGEIAPEIRRVFVGDYIDRGEASAQTLARLRAYQQQDPDRVLCLRGNHEQMLERFLEAPERHGPRWLRYGGLQTMASYGLAPPPETAPPEKWTEARDRLAEAMGPGLLAWIADLPDWWQTGNVACLHAAADPARPISEQELEHMLWGHPAFMSVPRSDGTWVLHGHTITEDPRPEAGRIPVDTGAYATGRLTAALVQPGSVEFFSV
ncbi:MAG: serine/threonine protein phosphatase [Rhodobacteraceae bacterium]|nr:serine/threonine protein phosphatase [Paracoccaceae bacterium]